MELNGEKETSELALVVAVGVKKNEMLAFLVIPNHYWLSLNVMHKALPQQWMTLSLLWISSKGMRNISLEGGGKKMRRMPKGRELGRVKVVQ